LTPRGKEEGPMPKIMIVDNNLTYRQMLADSLNTDISSSVISLAASRTDLIDQFRRFAPDIVLIDVQSTGTACFRLTEKFKAHHLALRVIWITSYDEPEYLQKARGSGVDYCLSKNAINPKGIIDIIFFERHADRNGIAKQEDQVVN
jgi:two-component system response regulator YesN